MVPSGPWPHCAEPPETARTFRASQVTSANGPEERDGAVRDGTSGALTNNGGVGGGGHPKSIARVVLTGVALVAGLVVVGGGIALFVTALFG